MSLTTSFSPICEQVINYAVMQTIFKGFQFHISLFLSLFYSHLMLKSYKQCMVGFLFFCVHIAHSFSTYTFSLTSLANGADWTALILIFHWLSLANAPEIMAAMLVYWIIVNTSLFKGIWLYYHAKHDILLGFVHQHECLIM